MASVLTPGQTVVELGGMSRIAEFLRDRCGLAVNEYTKDLRDPFDLPDNTFDLLLMLEVLEHLNDHHSPGSSIGEIAMFTGSGVKRCLGEAFRVLQPGGCVVLTTPNAVAVDTVGRVLLNNHPFQYPPHVREYAPRDVMALAEGAGFTVEVFSTFFAWSADRGYSREVLLKTIGSLGYDTSNRGDDAYFILRRPRQTTG
jgi:SAM-dependent methyltransferase